MPRLDPDTFPLIARLHSGIGETELRAAIGISNDDPIPRRLSLGIRLPDTGNLEFDGDMARLHLEIDMVARLIDRDREVVELHVDSTGVPGRFPMVAVRDLCEALWHQFHFSAAVTSEYSIGVDPRAVGAEQIAGIDAGGFNRIVFAAVPLESANIRAARDCGFRSTGIVTTGPAEAVDCAERLRPDRLTVQEHAECGSTQRPENLDEYLDRAGYLNLGLDHFALPHDDLALASKDYRLEFGPFGFTAHAECDSIGFGVGAISQVGDCCSQNADSLATWRRAVDKGRLPALRGLCLTEDDELRAEMIQQLLCRRQIEIRQLEHRYAIDFRSYFAADLVRLAPCLRLGLVRDFGDRIAVCSQGWPQLRKIAHCFDAIANGGACPQEGERRH